MLNSGHFEFKMAAFMGKIRLGPGSYFVQRVLKIVCVNFGVFIINPVNKTRVCVTISFVKQNPRKPKPEVRKF